MEKGRDKTYGENQNASSSRSSVESIIKSEDEAEAALVAVLEQRERRLSRGGSKRAEGSTLPAPLVAAYQSRSRNASGDISVKSDSGQTNSSRHRRKNSPFDGPKTHGTRTVPAHWSLYDAVMLAKQKGYGRVQPDANSSPAFPTGAHLTFADFAQKTREMHQKSYDTEGTSASNTERFIGNGHHRRQSTSEKLPFEGIGAGGGLSHGRSTRQLIVDNLFEHVEAVENLFQTAEATGSVDDTADNTKELDEEAGPNVDTPLIGGTQPQEKVACRPRKKYGFFRRINDVLDPGYVCMSAARFLFLNVLLIMVPCLVVAAIFFYKLGDPELDFLPQRASISWWLIFFVRQLITLQLAFCSQYFFVDMLSLRSTISVKVFGPLLTLFGIQGKGWPLVMTFWGLWDLLLIHGEQPFQKNWLYFTGIRMFSKPDNEIIDSDLYLRMLLSMIIAGGAVAVKRTYMALYLGKRMFFHFRQQLGSLMTSMILLTDIADLAEDFKATDVASILSQADNRTIIMERVGKTSYTAKRWVMDVNESHIENAETLSEHSDDESATSSENKTEEGDDEASQGRPSFKRADAVSLKSSGRIKDLLDNWKEPENKLDEGNNPSIHDILHFRRVLSYLDDTYPFTTSFGPADSRDRCIDSSQELYDRLLKLAPGEDTLPFDIIKIAAFDEYGQEIKEKVQMLVRLFRPNKFNKLTRLAFVQTCDGVYKKLRYFRASVANSTIIDKVLEQILNAVFYFVLILVVLAVLDFNPWTLLVSMSTLTVSFAFALGPSVSKLIEGILLIAVRRPYDLGDRLIITNAEFVGNVKQGDSWFVEDATLTTTTLRFAPTNEIATINNGAIANTRLINATRSPNALVNLDLLFHIKTTHEEIEIFRSAVEKYIKDNPRKWVKMVFLRVSRIEPNSEFIEYSVRFQHVKGWQDIPIINQNKGEIHKFCIDFMEKQGTVFLASHRKIDVFVEKNVGGAIIQK